MAVCENCGRAYRWECDTWACVAWEADEKILRAVYGNAIPEAIQQKRAKHDPRRIRDGAKS